MNEYQDRNSQLNNNGAVNLDIMKVASPQNIMKKHQSLANIPPKLLRQ